MESLNLLDAIILSLILGGALWGYSVGSLKAIRPTVLVFALITISYVYPDLKEYFAREGIVSFFLVLLLIFIGIIVWGFIARYFKAGIGSGSFGNLDRFLGLLSGIILGAVLAGFLVFVLKSYGGSQARNLIESSSLGPSVLKFFQIIMNFVENSFPLPKQ